MTSKAAGRRFRKAERLRAFRRTQREKQARQRGERLRSAFAALVCLTFGAVLTGYCGLMLAGAVGLSGTPGRLRVDSCAVVRMDSKPTTECRGELLSADGRSVDTDAVIEADARVGSTIAVRDLPLAGLETLGLRAITGWAALTATGLLVLCLGTVMALTACGRSAAATAGSRHGVHLAVVAGVGGLVHLLTVLCEHLFQ
ncbi:hypothetical protein TUSST3_20600 [Streptomyces sp. TUS-ST3]|uniref:hypothetical protein n=1 Tax=Streptomyces sp. TUS-ST3 TaxID=3025591 RepID=UPI00235B4B72|nr:hypothetical protein [Streptomyces sp. TUS-ST3]GLP65440.1 hypothetical protein TUSST3_20600 [Streptomyces sp. TUS-ST3]